MSSSAPLASELRLAFHGKTRYVRPMFPDAKWLDALKLPIKAKIAIALACGALFYLFKVKALILGPLDGYITPGLPIALVLFAVLVAVDGFEWLAKPLAQRRRTSLMAARRAVRAKEREDEQDAARLMILQRLNHLSREEIRYVTDSLEKNTPTFYTYVYAGPVGVLQAKGLIWSTGGTHNQDHYPFSFHDFVWQELLGRRDEFIAKESVFKEAEAEADRAARGRGRFG